MADGNVPVRFVVRVLFFSPAADSAHTEVKETKRKTVSAILDSLNGNWQRMDYPPDLQGAT